MVGLSIIRTDLTSVNLRAEAARSKNARASRRVLAIAMALDGHSREAAAEACAMDEWTPSDIACAQAASTAGNPSVSTVARMATICRSPSSEPASLRRTRSSAAGNTQSLNGAPLRSAPGLAGQDRHVMPRIVDRLAAPMMADMFRDRAPILTDDDPIGVRVDLHRPSDGASVHRVFVVVEAHETGLRHRRRQRMETIEPAAIRHKVWPLRLENLPHRLIRPFRVRMHLGVSDTFVGQPGVQFVVGFDPQARREETFPDQTNLVLDLTLLPS
jgi:hypothetical protein